MSKKIAFITGINGMDGSNLAKLLLNEGIEVHGTIRRSSWPNTGRIDDVLDPDERTYVHYGDLQEGFAKLLYDIKPNYIFNTAAMSHVKISFDIPIYTAEVVGVGVFRLLEDIRNGIRWGILDKDTKMLQCSSSEMFGTTPPPQSETSTFNPVSPYGISKLMAYHAVRSYRTGYGMLASNSICFNHEGIFRGVNFVTRKITQAACKIKLGLQQTIRLGNLDAKRDWGDSTDYVKAMWMIMQHDVPDDWVIATGETHTVREFLDEVFEYLDISIEKHVIIDESYKRPNEVPALLGNSDKIRTILGWKPKVTFKQLVKMMVDYDLKETAKHVLDSDLDQIKKE